MGMLWSVAGKSLFITTINGHPLLDMFCSMTITSIAVGPTPEWHDNNCFITGHEDGSLRFWKLRHEQAYSRPEAPADNGTVVFQRGRCKHVADTLTRLLMLTPLYRYRAHMIALYNRDTPNFTGEIHGSAVSHIKFLSEFAVVTGSVDGAVLQVDCAKAYFRVSVMLTVLFFRAVGTCWHRPDHALDARLRRVRVRSSP
jgi:WD40 repeat protein